ncbi:MAG: hypothetical protein AAF662_04940 [Pseudomonadota bacterium]
MGRLENSPGISFDAQLAIVTNRRLLRRALQGVRFTGTARYLSDLPPRCWIGTTRGAVPAWDPRDVIRPNIRYSSVLQAVVHLQLVQLSVTNGATDGGDSGGPVMSRRNGGTLLGMHIAGGGRTTYFIPAWQLFEPRNYSGASSRERWDLVNP